MQHKDKIVLQKILEVINETAEISINISEEEFLKNNLLKMAMTMAILRIGELVKNLDFEFRKENPQVKWKAIAGFRDIIAHKYEAVDMEEVYKTITEDFPELKLQIEKIMEVQKCTNM